MGIFESTVTIARPAEDVFRFFLDFEKNAADLGIEFVVKEPEGPTEVGTTFRLRDKAGGNEMITRYTSLDPNKKIEFDGEVGPLRPKGVYIFEPAASGTRVTIRANPNPVGPLKLVSPLVTRIGKRVWDKRFARIKKLLEAPQSPQT